jgi:hypothetical protein
MFDLPFDRPGRFWKGNLHTHSTYSDGELTPEQVCAVYRSAGYHFIALTDHFSERYRFPITDTRPYWTDNFITILGAELHAPQTELGDEWHILAVGLPEGFAPTALSETGAKLADRALAAGAFVAAAHPHWYNLSENDICSLGPIHALETYNGTAIDDSDRQESWYLLDNLLARGSRYLACATDDAHFSSRRHDALRAWVWVKSEALTPDAVLAALKAGHYYSSTGPQIHAIQVYRGEKVVVRCSPAERVFITGRGANFTACQGVNLIEAELSLQDFTSPYCRVTVRDGRGGRAWSNPIWF